jgi:hypothetical protein
MERADQFIGDEIEVEQAPGSPRPVRFVWRDDSHEVAEALSVHVDTGFGDHPPRYARRHYRYYVVRDAEGFLSALCPFRHGQKGLTRPAQACRLWV